MSVRNPQEIHAAFEKAFSSGDLDGLVALFEEDAVLVAAGKPLVGHGAIRAAYQRYLAAPSRMTLETVAAFESEGLALLHGRWSRNGTGPDGAAFQIAGRSSEVVRRQPDGSWLFIIDNPFTPE